MKRKLLIGTTNQGKFKEISSFLDTLPFELVSLNDLKESITEPEETESTLEGNALLKARYYGDKTGLLTLTDDTGLFIDALQGWPGVASARIASTNEDRSKLVLEKMKDVIAEDRGADFRASLALYDPLNNSVFLSTGKTRGSLTFEPSRPMKGDSRSSYSPLFFCEELGKTYAEMTDVEKNSVSHRGKALNRIKYHLQNTYSGKHIVVPCAIIIKDSKLLMALRNDPHRPEYHRKWEFPGGTVEFGENLEENIKREVKEESGYDIKVIKLLQNIAVESQQYPTHKYQIYLVPYVCQIIGGDGKYNDEEVLDVQWFDLDEVLKYELVGENATIYERIMPELKQVILENSL